MLNRIIVLLLVLGHVSLFAETRYFVSVGVNTYESPLVNSLRGAENDATLVATSLSKYAGFESAGNGSRLLLADNGTAGRQQVLDAIRGVAEVAKKEDAFVFFFAGHGILRGRHSYLVAHDTDLRDERIESSGLDADVVRDAIAELACEKKLVILDACRNDPLPSRGGGNSLSETLVRGLQLVPRTRIPRFRQNRVTRFSATLYSCGPNERAFERPFEKPVYGFFSFYLFKALKKAATGGKPYSIKDLAEELEEVVREETERTLGVPQEPWLEISGRYINDWSITADVNDAIEVTVAAAAPVPPPVATIPAPKQHGALRVASTPKGAKILLNGTATRHRTPAIIDDLEAGDIVVTLVQSGYRTAVKEVSLEPDSTASVDVELSRALKRVRAH